MKHSITACAPGRELSCGLISQSIYLSCQLLTVALTLCVCSVKEDFTVHVAPCRSLMMALIPSILSGILLKIWRLRTAVVLLSSRGHILGDNLIMAVIAEGRNSQSVEGTQGRQASVCAGRSRALTPAIQRGAGRRIAATVTVHCSRLLPRILSYVLKLGLRLR